MCGPRRVALGWADGVRATACGQIPMQLRSMMCILCASSRVPGLRHPMRAALHLCLLSCGWARHSPNGFTVLGMTCLAVRASCQCQSLFHLLLC